MKNLTTQNCKTNLDVFTNDKFDKKKFNVVLSIAQTLGTNGFKSGINAPYCDSEVMNLLEGHQIGNPLTQSILKAWFLGWNNANLAQ